MDWVLVLVLGTTLTSVDGFKTDWACKAAGTVFVTDVGDSAKFWCFPKDK